MPGEARWDDPELVELKLLDGGSCQSDVGAVRWVKGTAKNANSSGQSLSSVLAQLQSLRTRKLRVNAASGDSGGSSRL